MGKGGKWKGGVENEFLFLGLGAAFAVHLFLALLSDVTYHSSITTSAVSLH